MSARRTDEPQAPNDGWTTAQVEVVILPAPAAPAMPPVPRRDTSAVEERRQTKSRSRKVAKPQPRAKK
jgi:hypothetical protein